MKLDTDKFLRIVAAAIAVIMFIALWPPFRSPLRSVEAQLPPGPPFNCVVQVSTATTIQAVGGECVATDGIAHYVTGVNFSTNAAGIAADSFNTLKYGTGGTCSTPTIWWGAMTPAATQAQSGEAFTSPVRIPPSREICWINSTAGSKFITITGYTRYEP